MEMEIDAEKASKFQGSSEGILSPQKSSHPALGLVWKKRKISTHYQLAGMTILRFVFKYVLVS